MSKELVLKYLRKYRNYQDWLELYDEKITSNMAVSYDDVRVQETESRDSSVDKAAIRRDRQSEEFYKKNEYVKLVNMALQKLLPPERLILEHKFNLINNQEYENYRVGYIPDVEIYSNSEIPFKKDKYYKHKKNAYRRFADLITAIF